MNIPGLFESLSSGKAVYSDGFLDLEIIPDNIAIIGGGVIGLEFASFLCMINRSHRQGTCKTVSIFWDRLCEGKIEHIKPCPQNGTHINFQRKSR